jgi:Fic/DOC family
VARAFSELYRTQHQEFPRGWPIMRGESRQHLRSILKFLTVCRPTGLHEELFREILEKANQIEDPFEQSFFALVHLPYIEPFDDVNKRVSRLAANNTSSYFSFVIGSPVYCSKDSSLV